MLRSIPIDPAKPDESASQILTAWQDSQVVHAQAHGLEPDQVRDFYEKLLPRIGTPHYLAEDVRAGGRDAQRTGQLWMEVRFDPALPYAYRHSQNAQPLHTDGSYIAANPNATLMCCVRNDAQGGETVFISASHLYDSLKAEDPDLLAALETTAIPHERSGDSRTLPAIRNDKGVLRVNWNYYCVCPNPSKDVQDLTERFHAFLQLSPGVRRHLQAVRMVVGDAVMWRDDELLHGRNSFEAETASQRFLWKCAVDIGVFGEARGGSE